MTIEEFKESIKDKKGEPLTYAQCHRCCFGGLSGGPREWPIYEKSQVSLLNAKRLHCPICGHGDDTSELKLNPIKPDHRYVLDRLANGNAIDEVGRLRKQLEEKEKELAAAKIASGQGGVVASGEIKPKLRGQHQ